MFTWVFVFDGEYTKNHVYEHIPQKPEIVHSSTIKNLSVNVQDWLCDVQR
jgi:hypothetical protein